MVWGDEVTDNEKSIMVRLCTKLLQYADLEEDKEAEDLINWVVTQHSIKENNNKIRDLTGEYKYGEHNRRKGIKEALERGKMICLERDELYEQQQELKHRLWEFEQRIL